jgi:ribosomal protein L29
MKIAEIRKLNTEQLATETSKLRDEITQLRRGFYNGEATNVRLIRTKRKDRREK